MVQQNRHIILDGVFGTATPIQVGSSMAFAKYLSHVGITAKNYPLFLKIVETNNRWVVDELVGDRDPRLFFTVVRPNTGFIRRAFELLSAWHPGQIYSKVLLTVLGAIEYSFHKPDDGFNIYRLSITDLHWRFSIASRSWVSTTAASKRARSRSTRSTSAMHFSTTPKRWSIRFRPCCWYGWTRKNARSHRHGNTSTSRQKSMRTKGRYV